jgi:hypothetical protein
MKSNGKANEKRLIKVVLMCLALAAPLFSLPAPASSYPSQESPASVPEASSLRTIWRDLGRRRADQLLARADELWQLEPELTLQAMILRGGREIPPTLSATRREERVADRETALGWIRTRPDGLPEASEGWYDIARGLLAEDSPAPLACAAARAAGLLRAYGLADELSLGLRSGVPEVRQASRQACFALYLRWFEDAQAFEGFCTSGSEFCNEELYEVALELEGKARDLGIKLLRYEPQRAVAGLADPDPRLRAAAATTLGRVGNGGAQEAIDHLLGHLGPEIDGGAYLATIEALLQTQAAAAPDAPNLRRLRSALRHTIEGDTSGLQAPVALALARLPWAEVAEGEDSILVGVALLVGQLDRLMLPERWTDGDVLISSLKALHNLCGRARSAGLFLDGHRDSLRATITRLIEDEEELEGVRVAATQLLPTVGTTEDISRAVAVLDAPGSSAEFRYTLLGVLGDMSRDLTAEDPGARLVLDTMLERLSGDDSNLRRRALSYLTDERFRGLTSTADPAAFVASLGRETAPDLRAQLLDLIALHGRKQEVDTLIAVPTFDAIANGGPAGISKLVHAMRRLSGGDAQLSLRGASRLLRVDNDGTRVLRLREVLGLVGGMDPEAAASLPPNLHELIVRWATELRRAAGSLPGGNALLKQLVEVHVPLSADAPESNATELAHVKALFLSDWIALDPAVGQAAEVLAHFGEALALSEENGDLGRRASILRNRARFHLVRGDQEGALADYRALLAAEATMAATTAVSVLEPGDLRKAGELIFARALNDAAVPLSTEALGVSLLLVGRPTWMREPAAVRVQDLVDLATRAARANELSTLDRALPLFASIPDLPAPPAEGEAPVPLPAAPEGVSWAGLLGTHEEHARLVEHRDRLRTQRAALVAAAEAAAAAAAKKEATPPPPPPEEDSPPKEGSSGDGGG